MVILLVILFHFVVLKTYRLLKHITAMIDCIDAVTMMPVRFFADFTRSASILFFQ